MNTFTPKWFYIKSTPKYKYVGQTTREDVWGYRGSGSKWTAHLDKQGITTPQTIIAIWCETPEEFNECLTRFCNFDYVSSESWANLVEETCWDGGFQNFSSKKQSQLGKKTTSHLRLTTEQRSRGGRESCKSGASIESLRKSQQNSEEQSRKSRIGTSARVAAYKDRCKDPEFARIKADGARSHMLKLYTNILTNETNSLASWIKRGYRVSQHPDIFMEACSYHKE